MRMTTICIVLATAGCVLSAACDVSAQGNGQATVGTWHVVESRVDGEPVDWRLTYTFMADKIEVKERGRLLRRGTFKVDTKHVPMQIVFDYPRQGAWDPIHWKAIYEFDSGQLRMCFTSDGRASPVAFPHRNAEQGFNVLVFSREQALPKKRK